MEEQQEEVKSELIQQKEEQQKPQKKMPLDWDIPVFYDGNNNTQLKFKNADEVEVKIISKHPAGQNICRIIFLFT